MHAEIYTTKVCPYCVRAKAILKDRGIPFTEIDAPTNREEMDARVTEAKGEPPRMVPQIFLDGAYIGGCDDLVAHFARADLQNDLGGFDL